jgi:nucleoside-diphosphate-sugar epimerase
MYIVSSTRRSDSEIRACHASLPRHLSIIERIDTMRIIIIGGNGHIGTWLIPRLVESGHTVVNVSRGAHEPYHSCAVWAEVEQVKLDRVTGDEEGTFGRSIKALRPDVVIDMICFTPESARHLVEALSGNVQHFLFCGTIWVHGHSTVVPATEDLPRQPFGEYGIKKAEIEAYLIREARLKGFPATILHPGHIAGPGWAPLNPAGHFNLNVFNSIAKGEPLTLPNMGMETIHHVHADDVAQAFMKALSHWSVAIGESFHVVSPAAVTLRGYAEAVYSWFGRKPALRFLPWEEFRKQASRADADATWDHITHSPSCSIEKARRLLDYRPRYTSLEAVREAVDWLVEQGRIDARP